MPNLSEINDANYSILLPISTKIIGTNTSAAYL
jgi:hypothetical protein